MSRRTDEYYMGRALLQAEKARKLDEVPVGALVVDQNGIIVGRGYNMVETHDDQRGHAEMRALAQAVRKTNGWRLDRCTLYITLEPCLMCLGYAYQSRVERIVYGASSPVYGVSHLVGTLPEGYKKELTIVSGLREKECSDILVDFFSTVRKQARAQKNVGTDQ